MTVRSERESAILAKTNRELQALVAFSRAAGVAETVEGVAREIVHAVRGGFGFDRAAVFIAEGDGMRGIIGTDIEGNDENIHKQWWTMAGDPKWDRVTEGESDFVYTIDATREHNIHRPDGAPIRHHMLIPLRPQQEFIGVIAVDNAISNRPFGEEHVAPLLAFARQAATALQNVQLVGALRTSEERLRSLVTSLTETLYSVRVARGAVIPTYYSPQVEALTGYTAEESVAIRDFWRVITHPDDRARVQQAMDELKKGRPLAIEYRIVHRNGQIRWILDTPVPIGGRGEAMRINGSMMDITERKRLEERLRQAQKMETVGTLAGGIAHDFNNLLAIVKGNVTEAQYDVPPDNPACFSLDQAQVAIDKAASLVEQLLTFSRKTETAHIQISIDSIVNETMPLLQSSLGKQIRLDVRCDPELEEVFADPAQLQLVLINLCMNARDAMPVGGTITIRAQNARVRDGDRHRPPGALAGDYVRLQVHDTGTGMDVATQERIFEPLFTTKPIGRGTGLGLAVVYAIVGEHHGWIEVKSAPGEGSLFSVYLPAVASAQAVAEQPQPQAERAIVLIVDEDAVAREQLAGLLESNGYTVLTAANGSEALAIYWAEAEQIDLVVCALDLVEMGAAQLVGHLRSHDPDVALLLSSASDARMLRASDRTLQSVEVLRKPYQPQETLSRVRGAIHDSVSARIGS